MTDFVDVSAYQGTPNWSQVTMGAISKATEGTGFVDPQFARNWNATKGRTPHGAYHFARPDVNQASSEAAHFVATVGAVAPTDVLVLDLETGGGDQRAWALTWLQMVEKDTGITPWIYGNAYFLRAALSGDARFTRYPLWIAGYPTASIPAPWTAAIAHQYTDKGSVPGITGNVDMSHFYGSEVDLTPDEHNALMILAGAVAPGQKDAAGTIIAALQTAQANYNEIEDVKKTLADIQQKLASGSGGSVDLSEVNSKLDAISKHLGVGTP